MHFSDAVFGNELSTGYATVVSFLFELNANLNYQNASCPGSFSQLHVGLPDLPWVPTMHAIPLTAVTLTPAHPLSPLCPLPISQSGMPLSKLTAAALEDMGYVVDPTAVSLSPVLSFAPTLSLMCSDCASFPTVLPSGCIPPLICACFRWMPTQEHLNGRFAFRSNVHHTRPLAAFFVGV